MKTSYTPNRHSQRGFIINPFAFDYTPTPPAPLPYIGYPNWSGVKAIMQGPDPTEVKGHTVNYIGTSPTNADGKIVFPGVVTDDVIEILASTTEEFAAKGGAFCFECFVQAELDNSNYQVLFDNSANNGSGTDGFCVELSTVRGLEVYGSIGIQVPSFQPDGAEHHLLVARDAVGRLFVGVDGVIVASKTGQGNYLGNGGGRDKLTLGNYGVPGQQSFHGTIRGLRYTVGHERYNARLGESYDVPSMPYPEVEQDFLDVNTTRFVANFEGADGSTTFTDIAGGYPITPVGSPAIETTDYPNGALRLDGSSYLYTDSIGGPPGDYTLECFMDQQADIGGDPGIFQFSPVAGGLQPSYADAITMASDHYSGEMNCIVADGTNVSLGIFGSGMKHYCIQRRNGVAKTYVDGVLQGTIADTYNYSTAGLMNLVLGGYYSPSYLGMGLMRGFRFTHYARYRDAYFNSPDFPFVTPNAAPDV